MAAPTAAAVPRPDALPIAEPICVVLLLVLRDFVLAFGLRGGFMREGQLRLEESAANATAHIFQRLELFVPQNFIAEVDATDARTPRG